MVLSDECSIPELEWHKQEGDCVYLGQGTHFFANPGMWRAALAGPMWRLTYRKLRM
jgi:hypothetical protein